MASLSTSADRNRLFGIKLHAAKLLVKSNQIKYIAFRQKYMLLRFVISPKSKKIFYAGLYPPTWKVPVSFMSGGHFKKKIKIIPDDKEENMHWPLI